MSEPLADSTVHTENQCLASALFYEARGETLVGKRAVLDVIHHRMKATGKSACAIIKQRGQFSWYPKKPIKRYDKEMQEMLTAVKSSGKVLINEKFVFFFRRGIKPRWTNNLDCRIVGKHNFCKERHGRVQIRSR